MRKETKHLFDKKSRFSIRKLTIGTCSIAIGSFLIGINTVQATEATENELTSPVVAERAPDEKVTEAEVNNSPADEVAGVVSEENSSGSATTEEAMADNNDYKLHYNRPAANTYEGWEHESLPIGNGEIGSKVFGLVGAERIQFNEKTLWSGGPTPDSTTYNGGNFPNRHAALQPIREALENGNLREAKRLAESQLVGPNNQEYGRYLAFGDINVNFTNQEKTLESVTDYRRELDLKTAIASTAYTQDGTEFRRESFVSFPDDVSVTHFEKTGEKTLDFELTMRLTDDMVSGGLGRVRQYSNQKSNFKTGTVTYGEDGILLSGVVNNNQLQFASFVGVKTDGLLRVEQDKLVVTGASYATLLMNAKTNFAQDPKNNYRQNIDVVESVKATVNAAKAKSYADIRQSHVEDYQTLYNRVKLNITSSETIATPTNELLRNYNMQSGQQLEELFFQYGRYLMITSSRNKANALPANLQGVWNAVDNPPWNSDYHMNVNLQMNYWPVYSTNIAETALPLINYVDDLRYYGRIAAKEYANIVSGEGEENGWLAHTQATPFGWTTPGWSYYWGWSPASNAWIMQNVYDYYKFTKDEEFLREKIYPMLKETAKFWNSFLHYDQASDRWVSSPSYSPEHGTITIGNTFDQSLVWQLFHDYMEAANILKVDQEFVNEVRMKFDKLKPLHINQAGRIKEWYEEDTARFTGEGVEAGHRHVSELVGLFPGTLFSKDRPEFLEAARNTLNHRGDGGTGWSKANKINLWARLLDGNRAHRLLSEQLRGSTLNNLWDTHSPFQIDGNFGATSGMTEMLLQSHTGYIAPLAALPDAWRTGEVSGLMARGNVEVDMKWKDKVLTTMKMTAHKGGTLQIDYPSVDYAVVKVNGEIVTPKRVQANRIELMTNEGDVVTFESFIGRVANVVAERKTGHTATISFDAMQGARKYTIEREDLTAPIGTNRVISFDTDRTKYEDNSILSGHSYRYSVKAHLGNIVTASSDTSTIEAVKLIMDDRDPAIHYGSLYGNWSDSALYGGTEKYADLQGRPSATPEEATATLQFFGKGIEVYGLKTPNLGQAIVTIDGREVEELDFYATSASKKVLVGRYDGLEEGLHTLTIRVKPQHKGRQGERAKISLDYFKVLTDDPSIPEVLDDRDPRIQYGSEYKNWQDRQGILHESTEKYIDINGNPNADPSTTTMTLTFTGTGIRVYGIKSPQLGRAIVTIDGQPAERLDFYNQGSTLKKVLVGEYSGLANKEHTITIQLDPDSPQGRKKLSLDYFEILKPERVPVYAPKLTDVMPGDTTLKVTLPEGDWTAVYFMMPGIDTPIGLARDGSGGYILSNGGTVTTGEANSVNIELPSALIRTGEHGISAATLRDEEFSNVVTASIIVHTTELVDGDREAIDFTVETVTDDTKYTDYSEVRTPGVKGERLHKNRIHKVNGVVDTTKTEVSVESTVTRQPVNEVRVVGTKAIETSEDLTREEVVAYTTERRNDDTIPAGEERVQTEGKNGTVRITIRKHYNKGNFVREEEVGREVTVQPVTQVVLVGTKGNVMTTELVDGDREEIDFTVETVTDDTKYTDYSEVRTPGVKGERLYKNRIHKVNDVIDESKTELRVESVVTRQPVNEVRVVGTKAIETSEELTREEVVAYTTERRNDDTIPVGEERVQTEGKNGTVRITIRKHYNKGNFVREEEVGREVTVQPVTQVVLVGTKKADKPQSEQIVYVDEPTGVKITISSSEPTVPSKFMIAHSEQPTDTTHPALIGRDYDLYDIELFDDEGNYVQLKHGATVEMPADAGKQIEHVYYLPEGGEAQSQTFRQKDGRVEFTVPHFSQYAIVYAISQPTPPTGGTTDAPKPDVKPDQPATPKPDVKPDQPAAPKPDVKPEQPVTPKPDTQSDQSVQDKKDRIISASTTDVATKSSADSKETLPATGEEATYAIFGAAALTILASVGLVVANKKEE
ncbi:glycoside hydrolase N-terminal domain-containing protein [Aerococcaceae bacterium NML191219]|nr:glycoside hydrolase N-terminal domain-containing protein [Aerococcaceae bacterium NML191219]